LIPSLLTPPNNSISVLFVAADSLELVNTPACLRLIYPAAKSVFPEIRSLHLASSSLMFFMKNNTLEFHSIEVL
jgi:hypothetical protein